MSCRFLSSGPCCIFILGIACAVQAMAAPKDDPMPEPKKLPWKLRDHYTFSPERFEMIYGADNGQWTLSLKDRGTLIDKANASITFGDGKVVEVQDIGIGTTTRHKLTAELGEGTEYIVNIPSKDGISVRHSMEYHIGHPYYVVRVQIKNEGKTPVAIAKISPIVIPPGSLKAMGPNTTVGYRRMVAQGPCTVYTAEAAPYAVFMHDPDAHVTLAIGSLTDGRAQTAVEVQPFSGAWQGGVTSTFSPPVRVDPGQTLECDPAWLCFTIPIPADVDLYNAQAYINFPKPSRPDEAPRAWVTVMDGEPFAALQTARNNWDIDAALVPGTWEGRPGSLDGASPDWPRDMKNVAAQLHQSSVKAGITIDPLVTEGGKDAFTAKSDDGRIWINPAHAEGAEYGVAQVKKIVAWGFDFYVVAPSRIPDEVLAHFNISRAAADARAYDIVLKAVGGAPVYAASRGALGGTRDEWLDAAAATARMAEYGAVTGPVRLDASKVKDIDDETETAIAFCGAPIELIGVPSTKTKSAIKGVVSKRYYLARPLDVASPAPKLWQIETTPGGNKDSLQIAIVSFSGARTSTPDDLKTLSGTPAKTLEAVAAGYVSKLPSGGPKK